MRVANWGIVHRLMDHIAGRRRLADGTNSNRRSKLRTGDGIEGATDRTLAFDGEIKRIP